MKRFITFAFIASVLSILRIAVSLAFTQAIIAPPGAVTAEVITIATTLNGSTLSASTVNITGGNTLNVTLPNATPTTDFGAVVSFMDANGKVKSQICCKFGSV